MPAGAHAVASPEKSARIAAFTGTSCSRSVSVGAAATTGMHTRMPPAPSARKRKLIKHSLDPAGESGLEQAQPAGKRQATHHVNAGSARGAPRDARFVPREHCMQPSQAGVCWAGPSVALHEVPVPAWPGRRSLRECWCCFQWSCCTGMSARHVFVALRSSGADHAGQAI